MGEAEKLWLELPVLWQASEMESMANMTIQAILTGSANREAQGSRKRKLPDIYEEQAKRHNSLLSEGETYPYASGQQQVTLHHMIDIHSTKLYLQMSICSSWLLRGVMMIDFPPLEEETEDW